MLALARGGGRVSFAVRVTPRASADRIGGLRDGALLVRVTAPPVDGKANQAVRRLVARALDLAPAQVQLVGGATGRTKVLSVPASAEAALAALVK